jgi:hypothetical protein
VDIICSPYVLQRLHQGFSDLEKFDIARYISPSSSDIPFCAFSMGGRSCAGKKIALEMASAIVEQLCAETTFMVSKDAQCQRSLRYDVEMQVIPSRRYSATKSLDEGMKEVIFKNKCRPVSREDCKLVNKIRHTMPAPILRVALWLLANGFRNYSVYRWGTMISSLFRYAVHNLRLILCFTAVTMYSMQ